MGLNMNENWFEIVEILRNTLDSNYSKAEFVSAVENCFRVLGWRKTNGSLIKNYNLPNGSNVDIVLSKTSTKNASKEIVLENRMEMPILLTRPELELERSFDSVLSEKDSNSNNI